jgi:hypothetical protein
MELFNIISAQKVKDDSIVLTIDYPLSEAHQTRRFADIRMGIHWPTSQSPACFIVVSQEYGSDNPSESELPVGKREEIAEYISESLGMNGFYQQIVELTKKTLCRRLYAVLPEDRFECGYLQDLEVYAKKSECDIYVNEALDADNFFHSISRIKDSIDDGNLLIPNDTVLFDQLNLVTRDDLQDSPEERFFCIDPLGHVLDGYYRQPPRNYPLITRRRPPPDWRYH